MGWTGAAIPEAYGGAGSATSGCACSREELGSALAPVPFSSSIYLGGGSHHRSAGSEAQKQAWLPKLRQRHASSARWPWPKGPARPMPSKLRTTLRGGALTGEKLPGARRRCRRPGGRGGAGRPRPRAGDWSISLDLAFRAMPSRPSIPAARMRASVSPARRRSASASRARARRLLRRVEDRAAVLVRLRAGGRARKGRWRWRATMRWSATPSARPIGSFQAIKHKLADVYVATELARVQRLLRRLGAQRAMPPSCRWRPRRPGSRRTRPISWRPRRTSRCTAAWVSPGSSIAICTIAGPSCCRWRSAAPGCGKSRLIARARDGQRPLVSGGKPWISKTRLRKPNSAPACAPSSTRAPSAASPAPAWFTAPATRIPSFASAPRPGRQRGRRRLRRHHLVEGLGRTGGGSAIQQVIYDQEEAKYAVPRGLIRHRASACASRRSAPGARQRHPRPLCQEGSARRGDLVPALLRAGRRLRPCWLAHARRAATAAIGSSTARRSGPRARTTATGACWSRAATSRRTKHEGLTYFFIDMKSPGIEIRPIKQISGASHFNDGVLHRTCASPTASA